MGVPFLATVLELGVGAPRYDLRLLLLTSYQADARDVGRIFRDFEVKSCLTLRHGGELPTVVRRGQHQDRPGWLNGQDDPNVTRSWVRDDERHLDRDMGDTLAAVARLLHHAAVRAWAQAEAEGPRSPLHLLCLGIHTASCQALAMLPTDADLEGHPPGTGRRRAAAALRRGTDPQHPRPGPDGRDLDVGRGYLRPGA
jgi:hypothetical protein